MKKNLKQEYRYFVTGDKFKVHVKYSQCYCRLNIQATINMLVNNVV
jgi:hypothetical protein